MSIRRKHIFSSTCLVRFLSTINIKTYVGKEHFDGRWGLVLILLVLCVRQKETYINVDVCGIYLVTPTLCERPTCSYHSQWLCVKYHQVVKPTTFLSKSWFHIIFERYSSHDRSKMKQNWHRYYLKIKQQAKPYTCLQHIQLSTWLTMT